MYIHEVRVASRSELEIFNTCANANGEEGILESAASPPKDDDLKGRTSERERTKCGWHRRKGERGEMRVRARAKREDEREKRIAERESVRDRDEGSVKSIRGIR